MLLGYGYMVGGVGIYTAVEAGNGNYVDGGDMRTIIVASVYRGFWNGQWWGYIYVYRVTCQWIQWCDS